MRFRLRLTVMVAWLAVGLLGAGCGGTKLECGRAPGVSGEVLRFVAVGDTGAGSEHQFAVGEAMADKCQTDGCDFGLLLGDNIYGKGVDGPDDPRWVEKFEEPFSELDFPFYAVLGNHDYGESQRDWERGANQVEYAATHPRFTLPAPCYAFDAGPATFFGMDTQRLVKGPRDATTVQAQALRSAFETSDAVWKIAFGHHPFRSNGRHGSAGSFDGIPWPLPASGARMKKLFLEEVCPRADLYFAGHDHDRQILPGNEECPTHLIVSGAGSRIRPLGNDHPTLFQSATHGFMYVELTPDTIRIESIDTEGTLQAAVELSPAGEISKE